MRLSRCSDKVPMSFLDLEFGFTQVAQLEELLGQKRLAAPMEQTFGAQGAYLKRIGIVHELENVRPAMQAKMRNDLANADRALVANGTDPRLERLRALEHSPTTWTLAAVEPKLAQLQCLEVECFDEVPFDRVQTLPF